MIKTHHIYLLFLNRAKEYVIAKYENTWYRAKVLEVKKNQTESLYNVVYLEFTNVATLSEQNIRRYPADLTIPCHTNVCLIEGKVFNYSVSYR